MSNQERAGAGALITPGRVACGAAVVAWVFVRRHVRALERRVDAISRKAELARRDAERRFAALGDEATATAAVAGGAAVVATAAADVADMQRTRDRVRELIRCGEDAARAVVSPDAVVYG